MCFKFVIKCKITYKTLFIMSHSLVSLRSVIRVHCTNSWVSVTAAAKLLQLRFDFKVCLYNHKNRKKASGIFKDFYLHYQIIISVCFFPLFRFPCVGGGLVTQQFKQLKTQQENKLECVIVAVITCDQCCQSSPFPLLTPACFLCVHVCAYSAGRWVVQRHRGEMKWQ